MTHRDRAHRAATEARDELLRCIDEYVPSGWKQHALRQRVERLYSTCSLLIALGDEPVFPAVQTETKEEP